MRVLVLGSGGREHALAYRISLCESMDELYVSPGNPGTAKIAKNIILKDNQAILKFCEDNLIELVVVGPEQPLVDGIVDYLNGKGILVFGPDKFAARLEGEKDFSKNLMNKYDIPTAKYKIFEKQNYEDALNYLETTNYPLVIKASGLAAGKGVLICNNKKESQEALNECFNKKAFGLSGEKVVIEDFIYGEEASIFVITDGMDYYILPSAQDHKRIGEGDTGLNTGGMGAYSPAPVINKMVLNKVEDKIIKPTLKAMQNEGHPYKGCLYIGIMVVDNEPFVIEYNCRFGDPETQVVLPLVEGDFLELLYSSAIGALSSSNIDYNGGSAVCVVAASKGYPESYSKGEVITGTESFKSDDNLILFHAGTKEDNDKLFTNGGRVLSVTAIDESGDISTSIKRVYEGLDKIHFNGIYYRKDIAHRVVNR